jgi:hypothetical protein
MSQSSSVSQRHNDYIGLTTVDEAFFDSLPINIDELSSQDDVPSTASGTHSPSDPSNDLDTNKFQCLICKDMTNASSSHVFKDFNKLNSHWTNTLTHKNSSMSLSDKVALRNRYCTEVGLDIIPCSICPNLTCSKDVSVYKKHLKHKHKVTSEREIASLLQQYDIVENIIAPITQTSLRSNDHSSISSTPTNPIIPISPVQQQVHFIYNADQIALRKGPLSHQWKIDCRIPSTYTSKLIQIASYKEEKT